MTINLNDASRLFSPVEVDTAPCFICDDSIMTHPERIANHLIERHQVEVWTAGLIAYSGILLTAFKLLVKDMETEYGEDFYFYTGVLDRLKQFV